MDEILDLVEMVAQVTKDEVMVREILSAAKNLFSLNGLKKTTMEDIANAMGKGKSTLYYYFPGKIEIFEAVVDEELRNLLRLTRHAITMAATAKDKLKAYVKTRAAAMEKFQNLSAVVYENICSNITNILKLKEKHDATQIDLIREIINEGVQSGEFKEIAEKNLNLFSCILVAAFRGLELPLSLSQPVKNYENKTDLLVDIMVDGIKG